MLEWFVNSVYLLEESTNKSWSLSWYELTWASQAKSSEVLPPASLGVGLAKLSPAPATPEILPEGAEVGLSCTVTNTTRSPTRAFEPEETPGRCCYTWCMFPMGCLPRGSTTKGEEHYWESPLAGRVMGWVPWLWCPTRCVWLRLVPVT